MVKIIALCFAMAGLAAMPALACGMLEKADPKVGSIVASPPRITLTFTQAVVPASSSIKITDAAGDFVNTPTPVGSGGDTVLSTTLPSLAPGKYKVAWDVLWLDCNSKTQGTYKFSVP